MFTGVGRVGLSIANSEFEKLVLNGCVEPVQLIEDPFTAYKEPPALRTCFEVFVNDRPKNCRHRHIAEFNAILFRCIAPVRERPEVSYLVCAEDGVPIFSGLDLVIRQTPETASSY